MKKGIITITLIAAIVFAACQAEAPGPEKPLANDQQRVEQRTNVRASKVVPVLNVDSLGERSEFRLVSQTAKFTNDQKNEVELIFGNKPLPFCAAEQTDLQTDEQRIKLLITKKDNTEITVEDLSNNSNYDIQYSIIDQDGERALPIVKKLTITTLNNSIIRGVMSFGDEQTNWDGEYFAALCP